MTDWRDSSVHRSASRASWHHAYAAGFTLVELIMTIAIGAIIMTFAIPSYQSIIRDNRAALKANEFVIALSLARSEAAKRGVSVRVTAVDPSSATNVWGPGWRVWVDQDANGVYDDTKDQAIREFSALSSGSTMVASTGETEVRYLPTGLLAGATAKTFQLRPSGCSGNQGRNITLNAAGRPSVAVVACS